MSASMVEATPALAALSGPSSNAPSSSSSSRSRRTGADSTSSSARRAEEKEDLRSLLNFVLPPRQRSALSYPASGSGARKGASYSRDRFVHANFRFVVREERRNEVGAATVDPDARVPWDAVELVMVTTNQAPSCPICLGEPTAPRMTRCGHVYCHACVLRYLSPPPQPASGSASSAAVPVSSAVSPGRERYKKCPICHDAVYRRDLRSASIRIVQGFKEKQTVIMRLMVRDKDSIVALPVPLPASTSAPTSASSSLSSSASSSHNVNGATRADKERWSVAEEGVLTHAKISFASAEWILHNVIRREREDLNRELRDLEGWGDAAGITCVKQALDEISEREEALVSTLGVGIPPARSLSSLLGSSSSTPLSGPQQHLQMLHQDVPPLELNAPMMMTMNAPSASASASKRRGSDAASATTAPISVPPSRRDSGAVIASSADAYERAFSSDEDEVKSASSMALGGGAGSAAVMMMMGSSTSLAGESPTPCRSRGSSSDDNVASADVGAGTSRSSSRQSSAAPSPSFSANPSPASSPEGLKPVRNPGLLFASTVSSVPPLPLSSSLPATLPSACAPGSMTAAAASASSRKQGGAGSSASSRQPSSSLILPSNPDDGRFYFYQAADGQHLYLHPLNVRMLRHAFGAYACFPPVLTAEVIEIEESTMTEDSRRRIRYLSHLPLSCDWAMCEVALAGVVGKEVTRMFRDELRAREKRRVDKSRREARDMRRHEAEAAMAAAAAAAAADETLYPPLNANTSTSSTIVPTDPSIREEDFPTPAPSPMPAAWGGRAATTTVAVAVPATASPAAPQGASGLSFAMAAAQAARRDPVSEAADMGVRVNKGKKGKTVLSMGGARGRY